MVGLVGEGDIWVQINILNITCNSICYGKTIPRDIVFTRNIDVKNLGSPIFESLTEIILEYQI
jgi:hypothetical protein